MPMLMLEDARVTRREAVRKGLEVVSVDSEGMVELGVFEVPSLPEAVLCGPKGFNLTAAQPFFHQWQRASLAHEFVAAMRASAQHHHGFGVLLSGPNGVGKSAIGLQAFMTCFAQRLPVVYIPSAHAWVDAALVGQGDTFFFNALLRQNADLIAADPLLCVVLDPALRDEPLTGELMAALKANMIPRPGLPIGVIVDEVQAISKVLAMAGTPTALHFGAALAYFQQWQNWGTQTNAFVRLDIANSHGARELTIGSGDEHRLRIVKPWSASLAAAATTNPASPVAFLPAHEVARKRIVNVGGGMPRSWFRGKQLLLQKVAVLQFDSALTTVEAELTSAMRECCVRWFASLDGEGKLEAANDMLPLVRGQLLWDRAKGLYDDGLVARCGEDAFVTPVSSIAATVILQQLARHRRAHGFKPLSTKQGSTERGLELEAQVKTCLITERRWSLAATLLDGTLAPNVHARVDNVVPFNSIEELVGHPDLGTLYVPNSERYACDAITVPAERSDQSEPIVVWEASITDPRDPSRVTKCLKWFDGTSKNNIIQPLRAAHPQRPIVCALCWPEHLQVDASYKHKELSEAAADATRSATTAGATVQLAVVGATGLRDLGVFV